MNVNVAVSAAQHSRDWVDYAGVGLTLIGVIVVALYTYYAKKQWDEAKKGNKNLRASVELSHRAWVVCRIVVPESMPIASGKTIVTEIENTGGSPAMDVVLRYGWMCTPNADVPDRFPESDSDIIEPVGVLGNGHRVMTRTHIPQLDNPQEFIAGRRLLLVYGQIDYTDIFGEPRRTIYCRRYNDVGWTATAKYNEPN